MIITVLDAYAFLTEESYQKKPNVCFEMIKLQINGN